jgi:hypothetical protein
MDRPSTRSTVSVSSLIITRSASAGQCSIGEVLIPHPEELRLIGANQFQNTRDLVPPEAAAFLEPYGSKPHLGVISLTLDVNVWWLTPVSSVKEEPVRSNAERCWHDGGRMAAEEIRQVHLASS